MRLSDAIPTGQANALTKDRIAARLGWPVREFEAAVELARKAGTLAVCSGSAGYWRPESAAEYELNLLNRRRRAINQMVTVRGEREALRRLRSDGVQAAFGWPA